MPASSCCGAKPTRFPTPTFSLGKAEDVSDMLNAELDQLALSCSRSHGHEGKHHAEKADTLYVWVDGRPGFTTRVHGLSWYNMTFGDMFTVPALTAELKRGT